MSIAFRKASARRSSGTFGSLLIMLLVVLCAPTPADAANCIWTGGGTDALWSTLNNWAAPCAAAGPVNGDAVFFPVNAARPDNENDTANLQLTGFFITGTGAGNLRYRITGDPIILADNQVLNVNTPADINGNGPQVLAPLVLGANTEIVLNNQVDLRIGDVSLGAFNLRVFSLHPQGHVTIGGTITGGIAGVSLRHSGTGWLHLSGNNSFVGQVLVDGSSRLEVDHANGLGASGAGHETNVTSGSETFVTHTFAGNVPESFFLDGVGPSGGALRVNGTRTITGVLVLAAQAAISVGDELTLTGLVFGGELVKDGDGSLILQANNTYATTVITEGEVFVNGNQSASAVNMPDGLLGGTGTTGLVDSTGSGEIAPGLSPGILNTGSVAFATNSSLEVEMDGPAVGTGYDQLNVTGTVTLDNPNFDLALTFVPAAGAEFIVINNDGADPIAGTFTGMAQGAIVDLDGQPFHVNYLGGDGNDVVLSFAPNGVPTMPAIVFLALTALISAVVVLRLRRRAAAM